MGNRVYVGNLSFDTTRESIETAFSAVGQVGEISMPMDRESGRPRGFAFVTMGSAQDADAVIAQLDGSMLDGRALKVNEAKERQAGGGGRNGARGTY